MTELTLPFEVLVPEDAAAALSIYILSVQPSYEGHTPDASYEYIYAWDILTRHNTWSGIEPSTNQAAHLLAKASQLAVEGLKKDWLVHFPMGERIAYLMMNKKLPEPDIKLFRPPAFLDLPPSIWQEAEEYYLPAD